MTLSTAASRACARGLYCDVFLLALLLVPGLPLTSGFAEPAARMPFTWTPGQIELAVRVNGHPATFLLDTGAEYSVVSTRVASLTSLTLDRRGSQTFADDVMLELPQVHLPHQRVMVMPFDSYYQRGRHIDGLVGYDFFSRFVVGIDFERLTLTAWEASKFRSPRAAISVPLEFVGRLAVASTVLKLANGMSLPSRVTIDTGASQGIILRYPFANDHGLLALAGAGARQEIAPSLASGARGLVDVPVETATLGGWTFDRPRVQAFLEPRGSAASTATDGLMGNALLARFTLFIDYPHRRLLLQPRSHG